MEMTVASWSSLTAWTSPQTILTWNSITIKCNGDGRNIQNPILRAQVFRMAALILANSPALVLKDPALNLVLKARFLMLTLTLG